MEWRCRSLRYCGMYRPACRMNQTGVTSVRSRRHALRNRGRGWDNRLLASLLSDEDGVALELDLIRRDGMHGGTAEYPPGLEREHALVPRARHRAARRIDRALGQTGPRMRTTVRDRVDRAADVEQRHRVTRGVHPLRRSRRQLAQRRDRCEAIGAGGAARDGLGGPLTT